MLRRRKQDTNEYIQTQASTWTEYFTNLYRDDQAEQRNDNNDKPLLMRQEIINI